MAYLLARSDARRIPLASGSVDAIVTDPPARIGFMGKAWDSFGTKRMGGGQLARDEYRAGDSDRPRYGFQGGSAVSRRDREAFVAFLTTVLAECLRVAKPGARMLCWAIPRTSHWTGTAIEDAGWIIEDRVTHIFGQGFPKAKSKLKPAVEDWWKARKPLTLDDSRDIILQTNDVLEIWLWLNSPARLAESLSRSTPPGLGRLDSVRWLAAMWSEAGSGERSDLMATFNSPEAASTFWSIALLWSGILAAGSTRASTSTIATPTSPTTALRTLNCFLSATIPASIIQAASNQSGSLFHAELVGSFLNDARANWRSTLIPSAIEPVTRAALNTLASVAESFSLAIDTSHGVSAPADATTAADPAVEDWWLARKPSKGVPALNIDACRITTSEQLHGSTVRNDIRGGRFGAGHRPNPGDIADYEQNPAGRWPANLCLSHHPDCEQVGTRTITSDGHYPAARGRGGLATAGHAGQAGLAERHTAGETVAVWRCVEGCPVAELDRQTADLLPCGGPKRTTGDGGLYAMGSAGAPGVTFGDQGGASRFFYVAKATRAERDAGLDEFPKQTLNWSSGEANPGSFQSPGTERAARNFHPTVKSVELMTHLCRLIASPGELIADPFNGSGSTGNAALAIGCRYVGLEREWEYLAISRGRLALAAMDAERPHRQRTNDKLIKPLPGQRSLFDAEAG